MPAAGCWGDGPVVKTCASCGPSASILPTISSTDDPPAAASAAAHAQQATPKLTEPQSMMRTGTADERVARRAAFNALQSERLECNATIDEQPRAARSS